ncbi:MAG: NAD(P)-dependent oxidoreductase [Armatimonadetes bacterium]|nr:NAD(P)-dependent oxidoreductase [Armatimonadota bacterium]
MKLLVVGAAGHVGGILKPALEAVHDCRYLDLRPVEGAEARTVVGSLCDPAAVRRAMDGRDACIQLAMAPPRRDTDNVDASYDVHVKGMHRVLEAAVAAGCHRVVYASTMSVYTRSVPPPDGPRDESVPPDSMHLYGFTKRLGEEVCRAFAALHPQLKVLAFRMVLPRTEAQWAERANGAKRPDYCTAPGDLRRAYLAALEAEWEGFEAVAFCSDMDGRYLDMGKAQRLLGWVPEGV